MLSRKVGQAVDREEMEYSERRAEIETEAAQRATSEGAVRSHFLLAGLYLDRVHNSNSDGLEAAST